MIISKKRTYLIFVQGLLFLGVLISSILVTGCANQVNPDRTIAEHSEMVTESDETNERKRARIRVELALGYFEQGKTNIALDELKQAIAADPSFMESYSLRGLVYMRLNDFVFAEESFNKALSLKPHNSNILHNLGWLKCQQGIFNKSLDFFSKALNDPLYGGRSKTLMAQGLCQEKAGLISEAESSLKKSYEFDAGNPITGFNLARLLYQRGDFLSAQFYIRRLNNSELANAESLWLGIKVEKKLGNNGSMNQLVTQLEKRFPQSSELTLFHRAAFNE